MKIPDAVNASGVSKATWSQVETNRVTRNGVAKEVTAKPDTIARMAAAIPGVTPERLETEGKRPDAARILQGMLAERPGKDAGLQDAAKLAPVPSPEPGSEAEFEARYMRLMLTADPLDLPLLQLIGRALDGDGRPHTWEYRYRMATRYLGEFDGAAGKGKEGGALPSRRPPVTFRHFFHHRRAGAPASA